MTAITGLEPRGRARARPRGAAGSGPRSSSAWSSSRSSGPLVAPHDAYTSDFVRGASPLHTPTGPTRFFWLGADRVYRDEFARLAVGARLSLAIGVLATAIATAIGGAVGVVAGWFEGTEGVQVPWSMLGGRGGLRAGRLRARDRGDRAGRRGRRGRRIAKGREGSRARSGSAREHRRGVDARGRRGARVPVPSPPHGHRRCARSNHPHDGDPHPRAHRLARNGPCRPHEDDAGALARLRGRGARARSRSTTPASCGVTYCRTWAVCSSWSPPSPSRR